MTQSMVGVTLAVLLLACATVAAAADTLTITARQAAVRVGPDSRQTILTTVQQGMTFALLETRKGWYKILLDDGHEGWIAQAAVQVQPGRGLVVPQTAASTSQARTVLVIGNATYNEDIGPLKNPGNDATDMATTLRQL